MPPDPFQDWISTLVKERLFFYSVCDSYEAKVIQWNIFLVDFLCRKWTMFAPMKILILKLSLNDNLQLSYRIVCLQIKERLMHKKQILLFSLFCIDIVHVVFARRGMIRNHFRQDPVLFSVVTLDSCCHFVSMFRYVIGFCWHSATQWRRPKINQHMLQNLIWTELNISMEFSKWITNSLERNDLEPETHWSNSRQQQYRGFQKPFQIWYRLLCTRVTVTHLCKWVPLFYD